MLNNGKVNLFLLLFILAGLFAIAGIHAFSQDLADFKNISVVSDTDFFQFFNHDTGKLYVYSKTDGRLRAVWGLKRLGGNLQRFSSSGESY